MIPAHRMIEAIIAICLPEVTQTSASLPPRRLTPTKPRVSKASSTAATPIATAAAYCAVYPPWNSRSSRTVNGTAKNRPVTTTRRHGTRSSSFIGSSP